MGVYFNVLFHLLFSWLGLVVLGLMMAIFLLRRTAFGKRVGLVRLCVVGYLFYLSFLYWVGATAGPDSMGYLWLPLVASTFPWSFLLDPIAGRGLHVDGAAGMVLTFVLFVVVYGGMNSMLFLGAVRTLTPKDKTRKTLTDST